MKVLFESIMNKFSGSFLEDSLSGKMFLMECPEDVDFPFCVYMMENDISDYTFDDDHNQISMSFYLTSEEGNAVEVCDNLELLKSLYDDCKLSVAGYNFVGMERREVQLLHNPGESWQYMIRYEIQLEKE